MTPFPKPNKFGVWSNFTIPENTDLHQRGRPLSLQGCDDPGRLVTLDDACVCHKEVVFALNDVSEEDDVLNDKSHDRDQGNDDHHGCVQSLTSPEAEY